MITGGQSYQALLEGSTPFSGDGQSPVLPLTFDQNGGISLLNEAIIDTHFGHRGRQGRLIRLLSDTQNLDRIGTSFGIGIDEATALVIKEEEDNYLMGEVIGYYGVFFADVSQANVQNDDYWSIENVETHYLTQGDAIDLANWRVSSFGSNKLNLNGNEALSRAPTSEFIFGNVDEITPGEYVDVATGLINS